MALDTEEEQIEKIQRVWNNNKPLIIIVIVVFLGLYFVYGIYADKKIKNNEQASQFYQEILIEKITNIESIENKVAILKKESAETPYAARSSIYLSKIYSNEKRYKDAIKELIWASDNASEESIQSMAYYLLANLYFIENDFSAAMESANKIKSIGFQPLANDIIGDIYLQQGKKEEAKKSYLKSLKLHKGQGDIRKILQNKIDSIGQ